ncbi:MAG: tyrosine-type recombinase/integrase [Nitrospirae bacterium]|nr:tyrosine-type recombinase/integrase [Nitrospirota bacterium]
MGNISVNQNGRLYYYFYWQGRRHREGTKLADTPANRKRLEAHMRLVQDEIDSGLFTAERYLHHFPYGNCAKEFRSKLGSGDKESPTFGQYAEGWLTENAPPALKPSTYSDYYSTFKKHLLPAFSEMHMDEIAEKDLKLFRARLKGLSPKRINNIFVPLKTLLREAHRRGVIDHNPSEHVRPLKVGKADIQPFSVQEVRQLTGILTWYWSRFVSVAVYTGMRTGELLALKWSDVDLENNQIHVKRSVTRGVVGLPKTKDSQRDILMLPPVKDALLDLMAVYCLRDGVTRSVYVFANGAGNHRDVDGVRNRVWLPALERAKLDRRTLYQTRHTYASLMLRAGEDMAWIARQMGTSIEMLSKTYARFVQSATRQDGAAFMRMLGQ